MTRHRTLAAGLLAAVAAIGGAAGPASAANVPAGFRVSVLAHVPEARELAVCGETLFVGTTRSSVYAVPLNGRGGARQVATGLAAPNGVACQNGRLYVAMRDRVSSWPVGPGGELAGPRVDVFAGLPDKAHHGLRYIQSGPDGRLYLSIGSPCNICQPEGLEGSIIRMSPDGAGRETVATGIRNSVGFDWSPATGALFFTDNGADGMGDNRPPDEMNEVRQAGAWYGFPYFGGTERLAGFESKPPPRPQTPPAFSFPAHVATLGMHFYRGSQFPPEFRGDAFVAEHGSWNRSVPDGYQVVIVSFRGGQPAGSRVFASGLGRPVDVKELPDGSLAVSADTPGVIYRISYGE